MENTAAAAAATSSTEEISPAPAVKVSTEKMQLWIKKWFNDVKGYKSTESAQCILRFGVVTDSQYADIDDGKSFMGVKRYYRNALVLLQRAFDCWNECPGKISFIAQLGDLIDGQANDGKGGTEKALATIEKAMATKLPLHNLVGNHELYNFELPSGKVSLFRPNLYYSWTPHPQWRCICLNPFDISTICSDAATRKAAWDLIRKNNPNCDRTEDKMKAGNWWAGLTGPAKRFVPYNGAVGETQLKWLAKELQTAVAAKQRIILFSHVPMHPRAASQDCLLFNFPEVTEVLDRYAKGHVALVLCGHDHPGGYHYDEARGIHHVTFEAPLETDPKVYKCCHAIVEIVAPNMAIVRGAGSVASRQLPLLALPS